MATEYKDLYNSFGEPASQSAGYDFGDVEAALCVWEAILEAQLPTCQGDLADRLREQFDGLGTGEMRSHAIAIAMWAQKVWSAAFGADPETWDGIQFDWEFIPTVLRLVRWGSHGTSSLPDGDPVELAQVVLNAMQLGAGRS